MKSETGQGYMNKSKLKHLLFIIFFSFSSLKFTHSNRHTHNTANNVGNNNSTIASCLSLLVIPTSEPLFPNWTGYRSIHHISSYRAQRQKFIKQNTPSKSWKVRTGMNSIVLIQYSMMSTKTTLMMMTMMIIGKREEKKKPAAATTTF